MSVLRYPPCGLRWPDGTVADRQYSCVQRLRTGPQWESLCVALDPSSGPDLEGELASPRQRQHVIHAVIHKRLLDSPPGMPRNFATFEDSDHLQKMSDISSRIVRHLL
jgi:hypothetical protein